MQWFRNRFHMFSLYNFLIYADDVNKVGADILNPMVNSEQGAGKRMSAQNQFQVGKGPGW